MKNAPVKSTGAKDINCFHLYWHCLCLSAVGFKQKTALMAELVTKSKITVRKIVLKLLLYLYFRTILLKFRKVILEFRNRLEK